MTRNIEDIIKTLPVARQRAIEKRAAALIAEELTRQDLRRAHKATRSKLTKKLSITKTQIRKVEHETDLHLRTFRRSIEALGGTLTLVAEFPDRKPVKLTGIKAKVA